jgi:hypothetical protein
MALSGPVDRPLAPVLVILAEAGTVAVISLSSSPVPGDLNHDVELDTLRGELPASVASRSSCPEMENWCQE